MYRGARRDVGALARGPESLGLAPRRYECASTHGRVKPRSAPPRAFAPLKHKNATPFLWIATWVHRSRRRIREWKHRALLGFHRPTNRGSTTFSARDPLHNDTFAVAFDDPFESMIRAKEKKDEKKKKTFSMSPLHRTPLALHPSPSIHRRCSCAGA